MKAIQYLFAILICSIVLLSPVQPGFAQSQDTVLVDSTAVQGIIQPDSLYSHLDSTLNQRFQKVDSLLNALEGRGGEVADSMAAGGKETLAHLEEIISWQKIVFIVLFFMAVYYLSRFITILLDNFSEKVSKYRLRIKRMVPVMRVIIWVVAIYVAIAGIVQPPFATVITVLASVGIAVGLAAQDMLKNLFGGLMLILDRPFQVGDKIQFEDHYGEVQQIGLRSSRIVTPGDSVVTIPNGELIRTAVSNANTGALDCLVVTEIFLPANAPVEEVKEVAYKAVVSSRFVFMAKPISIMTQNEMHERRFILKLNVKAYVLDIRYEFPFQSDVTELILTELTRRGIIKDEALTSGKPAETE